MSEETPLWTPSADRIKNTVMARFMAFAADKVGRPFADYDALHAWSVGDRAAFWDAVWDFCAIRGEKGELVLDNPAAMPGATFFPEARLNFAENLLRRTDDGDAMVFRGEDKVERRLSWADLNALVSRLQQALLAAGVAPGDRVAAMLPNMPEAYAGMLAAASIGAIWSSCSPDFGERGVLDRFGQIEPKVFISCDAYWYNGKKIEVADKLKAVVEKLPSAETVLIVDYLGTARDVAAKVPRATDLDAALAPFSAKPVAFTRLPMTHPLYILFSSGTTGVPKCIVHSAGGTLLQHVKEHRLHCDVRPGDRVFYFTTCGWMMWNWLASALASEATLLLYDGSPFYPDGNVLFDFARDEKMTLFGTSAKFIDAVKKAGLRPRDTHDLSALRVMTSTGSPLAPESFDFVYDAIKPDLHLASISGGTDIVACFVGGVPTKPVYKGEIQGPSLGMAADVWSEDGRPVKGEKGELVCTAPFPSMPIMFWNDPEGAKYHAAYFERFPGVWCHGDFAEWTPHGGMIIHGRSDATLNPGGVRIGTAEIYNVVEQIPEVVEALAIGQTWEDDVRVVLFVRLRDGMELTEDLTKAIKVKIREGASPRHVPAKVVAVEDIPRTKSGKITELAVRDVVHGREVKNKEALANPSALELFAGLEELES
ncbi:acetoacetate--CoA ligase [Rhodobium gokarnense]|uniref:Acetoacetyl-CoA synthetase n=1 Tax=Rhodobium gokarnense TaxID=364296 RepID=A0ABT3HCQ6_9HYPH|nr:acetoacetate--CoA ligase [Rhodobium gokarnense]MCW2308071.1 acetoacetyl-CoA synthetase [Rhodobium gokarnense]